MFDVYSTKVKWKLVSAFLSQMLDIALVQNKLPEKWHIYFGYFRPVLFFLENRLSNFVQENDISASSIHF